MLSIKNLHYQYGDGVKALNGVNLTVEKGDKIAVLGSNGSGKSTLFLCLNGILKPSAGVIELDGTPIKYDKKGLQEVRRRIGFVFQDPEIQLFCLNVYQEVAFGPSNLGCSKEEISARTEESMKRVSVDEFRDKPPHLLSYGQKKRVSIAAVLSMKPELILFDEPTSALDPIHSRQTIDHINQLNESGITIIMSTHDMDLAFSWADKIAVMKNGRLIRFGIPEAVFAEDELIRSADLYQPRLYQIYRLLLQKGVLEEGGKIPKSVEELERLLHGERGQSN